MTLLQALMIALGSATVAVFVMCLLFLAGSGDAAMQREKR